MNSVRDICKRIGEIICDAPLCIETGTMYVCPPGNEIHTTTNNIMEFICAPKFGTLYSLEIDSEHINFSKEFCSNYDDKLIHLLGDSVESMNLLSKNLPKEKVDLLCLDGKEFDEPHMVKEFNAIKNCLAEKHFVLVDDIHNTNSVKWKLMLPLLKELDYSYTEVSTPTGMFLATKGYVF